MDLDVAGGEDVKPFRNVSDIITPLPIDWNKEGCVGPSSTIETTCPGVSYALTAQSAIESLYCIHDLLTFYRFSHQ